MDARLIMVDVNTAGRLATAADGSGAGPHPAAFAVIAIGVIVLIVVAAMAVSPRWRRGAPRVFGLVVGGLLAAYLVYRGVAEFWTIDYSDPASYRNAWGGPSLIGVFAVHTGPGLAVIIAATWWLRRRRHRADREQVRDHEHAISGC